MILSFTGSRDGMTRAQIERVRELVQQHRPDSIVHGDCIGADATFHELAILEGVRVVHIRPGHDRLGKTPTRAVCHLTHLTKELGVQCTVEPTEPYLVRDEKIVQEGDLLIATPNGYVERFRGSGTWSTVRLGHRHKKSIQIVYPDGRLGPYVPR